MADQSDIEEALVSLACNALYPSGTGAASVCGQPCRVYRGWPNAPALDSDLAEGVVNVTVSPVEGTTRNTTRFTDDPAPDPAPASLTATISGDVITFGGTAAAGQLAGIAADGKTYVYRTQPFDTPELVAANLAALARPDFVANLSGASVRLAGASGVLARVVSDTTTSAEVRRQNQRFRISAWCNDPKVRDVVASTVDVSLATISFIALPDGSQARLLFGGSASLDQSQNAALYRRDLLYDAEYATTQALIQPAMLFGTGTANQIAFIG